MMILKVLNHSSNYVGILRLELFATNRDKQKQGTYFSTPGRSGKASEEEIFSNAFNYEKNRC
jgi:hypothetical protein